MWKRPDEEPAFAGWPSPALGGLMVPARAASVVPPARYGLLLACTFASLAVQGIAPSGDAQRIVVSVLVGLTLFVSFRAAAVAPVLQWLAAAMAIGGVVLTAVEVASGTLGAAALPIVDAAVVALGPPAVALGVVRNLGRSKEVGLQAVMGVLALFMLMGMFFGFLYGVVDRVGAAPFFSGGETATVSRCLYFSFVTITTVGYGDLSARSDLGHTLSVFEALIGQIYLVTVVAVIVGNLGAPARRRALRERGADPGDAAPSAGGT